MNKELLLENIDTESIKTLIGVNDENLRLLEKLYNVDLVYRNDKLIFLSDNDELFNHFKKHIGHILNAVENGDNIDYNFIKHSFTYFNSYEYNDENWQKSIVGLTASGKPIKCKTHKQFEFVQSINKNDLIFSIGPAGTGKTFLAVLLAVNALKKGEVKKIVLTRPAVEAGENLGFLPGDLKEKVDPYLMPLYDSLEILLGKEVMDKYIEKGIIEVIPLAYMRGRTLNDCFAILDEAQNTTSTQMLMFLTRLGFNSKMIVNGDITQIDLNINKNQSGLIKAINNLKGLNKIAIIEFTKDDVVRNPLVQTIIENYK